VGICTIAATYLANSMMARRDREARALDFDVKRRQLWDEFRLKSLIDLQDTLAEISRVWHFILIDKVLHIKGLHEGYEDNAPRLVDELKSAENRLVVLADRVHTEDIRRKVMEFRDLADQVLAMQTLHDRGGYEQEMGLTFLFLSRDIGLEIEKLNPPLTGKIEVGRRFWQVFPWNKP
jgi:hypothetical protein